MLTEMQKCLLNMLDWLTKYLDQNSINYYIIGGTMLGAVRHNGFIPWDDDVDVGLPRPDYERFIELFKENDDYILETPYENNLDFLYTYSKLYDKHTTLIERQRKSLKRGIYIDIFPLDGLGNTYNEAYAFFSKVDRKNMLLMTRTCAIRKQRDLSKNMAIVLSRLVPECILNTKRLSLEVDSLCKKNNYNECSFVGNLNGTYREREIVSKDIFGKPTEYTFENIIVKGPEKADEFLTQIYYDWRKLPPVEKRGVQHDFIYCNLNESYLEEK